MAEVGEPPAKYQYNPSLAAAIIFAVLFGLSAIAHFAQLVLKRTWYFIPFLIGALFETVGYIARSINAEESPNWSSIPYIIQVLLTLLGPALFAASIYMVLGRIIRMLNGQHLSIIRINWLTKIFVFGDVLSFAAQCLGGGILSGADNQSTLDRGQNIILIGLGIQIIFFAVFILVILIFHYRIIRNPTTISTTTTLPWKQLILVLYFSSFLIMVRSIFRVAEFAEGHDGTLQSSEAYLYCLDTALMLFSSVAFNIYHPSMVVSHDQLKSEEIGLS